VGVALGVDVDVGVGLAVGVGVGTDLPVSKTFVPVKPKKLLYPAKRYLPVKSTVNLVATSGPLMVPNSRNVFASKALIPIAVLTEAYTTKSSGLKANACGYGPVTKAPKDAKSEVLNFAIS